MEFSSPVKVALSRVTVGEDCLAIGGAAMALQSKAGQKMILHSEDNKDELNIDIFMGDESGNKGCRILSEEGIYIVMPCCTGLASFVSSDP